MSDLTPEVLVELRSRYRLENDARYSVVIRDDELAMLLAAAEERDRMRAVVEAAKVLRGVRPHRSLIVWDENAAMDALFAALDALETKP